MDNFLSNPIWQLPPPTLILDEASVHIWAARLQRSEAECTTLRIDLCTDEHARADVMRIAQMRQFIVARGLLRQILSCYLHIRPHEVAFQYGRHGKPTLASRFAGTGIQFNLAHSNNIVVYAITRSGQIGIDIEAIEEHADLEAVARRFFAAEEYLALMALPTEQRLRAFYTCWTRKEAFIKALGQGLTHPLDSFVVSLQPNQPAEISFRNNQSAPWSIYAIPSTAAYEAAFVIEGAVRTIQYWYIDSIRSYSP